MYWYHAYNFIHTYVQSEICDKMKWFISEGIELCSVGDSLGLSPTKWSVNLFVNFNVYWSSYKMKSLLIVSLITYVSSNQHVSDTINSTDNGIQPYDIETGTTILPMMSKNEGM